MELPFPIHEWPRWVSLHSLEWKAEWTIPIFKRAEEAKQSSGWNPKILKLEDSLLAIDYAFSSETVSYYGGRSGKGKALVYHHGIPTEVCILRYIDHPILHTLPKYTPRAVKCVYTKEHLLKYVRADDYWVFHSDFNRAQEAWSEFLNTQ